MLYYPSSFLQLTNQTSMDEHDYSINNSSLNPFIFAAIWFILIVTIVCGSIGNLLVLYVYINRNDNKTCSFFIKMLAVVDFIICSVLVPLELYQTTTGMECEVPLFISSQIIGEKHQVNQRNLDSRVRFKLFDDCSIFRYPQ